MSKVFYGLLLFYCLPSCSSEKAHDNIINNTITEAKLLIEEKSKALTSKTKENQLGSSKIPKATRENSKQRITSPMDKPEAMEVIPIHPHMVIAKNGLFMREEPNRKGAKITKIPYHAEIEIMSTKSFGVEEVDIYGPASGAIDRHWVKVKYKDQVGYVLNLYIIRIYKDRRQRKILNDDCDFAYAGFSCSFNFHPNRDLIWYGIYKDGSSFERKPIQLEYQNAGGCMAPIKTVVQDKDSLVFCFASNTVFRESRIENGTSEYRWIKIDTYDQSLEKLGIRYISYESLGLDQEGYQYTLSKEGKSQILNTDRIESEYNRIVGIVWMGDIDEDGLDDYVINYGIKGGRTVLYLSGEAQDGEIVAPVAIYLTAYCC